MASGNTLSIVGGPLVQGRSGQVESGLEGGSPIEEAVGGAGSGLIGLHLEGMRPGELFTVYQGYQEQKPRPHLEAWRTTKRTWASATGKGTDLEPESGAAWSQGKADSLLRRHLSEGL